MIGQGSLLFSSTESWRILEFNKKNMLAEIEQIDSDLLLNSSLDDWYNYFEQKYLLKVPKLIEEKITTDHRDIKKPINDYGRNPSVPATEIIMFIPFEGEQDLFNCSPSSRDTSPPCAVITSKEVRLAYTITDHNQEKFDSKVKHDLSHIKQYLDWINQDFLPFNSSVREIAQKRIETRRQKLLKDRDLVAALGYPLRRRDNVPETYTVPMVKKKAPISRPSASTEPFTPEPTLEMQEYEHILSVISNMVLVIERSPKTFKEIKEEDLRQHFLVQLNGQYEGQATGETFNNEGKVDILIRVDGKNIFIAECKFWTGEKNLNEALNQLLTYTSWRDTKVALLIFNRNKDFSSVIEKIRDTIKSHSNFKRELQYNSETGFRCVLHYPDDKNRELVLTTLAFDIPK